MHRLDLRLVIVPALLNLILYLLQRNPWLPSLPNFNMNWKLWVFSIVTLMLFLITSVRLPLSVTAERIQVRIGDFSFFLVITLLGSVSLPQPLFWFGYIVIICISPWHGILSGLLVRFILSIWNILRGIPVLIITCILHNHQQDETETDPPPPPPPQVAVVADDIGGNPIEQPTTEPVTVLVEEP
ncbi:hypothetical protein RHSIM_Rhsim05G0045900 [Rhododendron simsii]|uniref:Uncharacterized protein n=1 Tax=Rhododendron simsii TaxID=118357 RepID=A0A834LP92_RHOSS|nr:hypothetical protein RHSIM_Rhsim05G0045900 [Rhododendron simsii]